MTSRYSFLRKLGFGSFGAVYLAIDQNTQQQVAIKLLTDTSLDGKQRFHQEAVALYQQIDNPFIVDLLAHDLNHEPPYLVLEYCEHGSLRSWVDERRAWQHIVITLAQIIQGLETIHAIGGFHRDLKPDNLLLASGPTPGTMVVKIADFGLARVPGTMTSALMTRRFGGTDGYIAPEVAGGAEFHPCADIYSLGIVATELLTGVRDPAALHGADIPASLRELVMSMCATDSTRRPTAREIAGALHRLLGTPPAPQPPSSGGVSPVVVLGGIALAGAALVALAALAGGDDAWDTSVRRKRGSGGRFKKG